MPTNIKSEPMEPEARVFDMADHNSRDEDDFALLLESPLSWLHSKKSGIKNVDDLIDHLIRVARASILEERDETRRSSILSRCDLLGERFREELPWGRYQQWLQYWHENGHSEEMLIPYYEKLSDRRRARQTEQDDEFLDRIKATMKLSSVIDEYKAVWLDAAPFVIGLIETGTADENLQQLNQKINQMQAGHGLLHNDLTIPIREIEDMRATVAACMSKIKQTGDREECEAMFAKLQEKTGPFERKLMYNEQPREWYERLADAGTNQGDGNFSAPGGNQSMPSGYRTFQSHSNGCHSIRPVPGKALHQDKHRPVVGMEKVGEGWRAMLLMNERSEFPVYHLVPRRLTGYGIENYENDVVEDERYRLEQRKGRRDQLPGSMNDLQLRGVAFIPGVPEKVHKYTTVQALINNTGDLWFSRTVLASKYGSNPAKNLIDEWCANGGVASPPTPRRPEERKRNTKRETVRDEPARNRQTPKKSKLSSQTNPLRQTKSPMDTNARDIKALKVTMQQLAKNLTDLANFVFEKEKLNSLRPTDGASRHRAPKRKTGTYDAGYPRRSWRPTSSYID